MQSHNYLIKCDEQLPVAVQTQFKILNALAWAMKNDKSSEVRKEAAKGLGNDAFAYAKNILLGPLTEALKDESEDVVKEARQSLDKHV